MATGTASVSMVQLTYRRKTRSLVFTQHEARAYARWVLTLGGHCSGAVLQHEYQCEAAARTGVIKDFGRTWESCAVRHAPSLAAMLGTGRGQLNYLFNGMRLVLFPPD